MKLTRALATLFALLLSFALVACGDDSDDGDDSSSSDACSDIWVAGETLPEDYEGCERGDTIEAPAIYECDDGSQTTGFDDRYYAKLGGEIYEVEGEMADDPAYKEFNEACRGGGDTDESEGSEGEGEVDGDAAPACSEVWVVGQILPADYEGGCLDESGEAGVDYSVDCTDGQSELFALEGPDGGDLMFAVAGQEIQDATKGDAYDTAYDACVG